MSTERFTNNRAPFSRRQVLKGVGAFAMLSATVPLLGACGGDDDSSKAGGKLEELRKKGVARLGMSPAQPYCYVENNKPTGLVNDEATMLLKSLGIEKVEAVVVDFAALVPGLIANRFDVCTGALYITSERCDQVRFANPDTANFEAFAVESGNPLGVANYADLASNSDAVLGAIAGSAEISYAEEAGVEDSRIKQFPDALSALEALSAGRVNVVGYDNVTLGYQLKSGKFSGMEVLDPFTVPAGQPPTYSGMAFNMDAADLQTAMNNELKKIQDSGELAKLAVSYGFSEENVTSCYGVKTATLDCANA